MSALAMASAFDEIEILQEDFAGILQWGKSEPLPDGRQLV